VFLVETGSRTSPETKHYLSVCHCSLTKIPPPRIIPCLKQVTPARQNLRRRRLVTFDCTLLVPASSDVFIGTPQVRNGPRGSVHIAHDISYPVICQGGAKPGQRIRLPFRTAVRHRRVAALPVAVRSRFQLPSHGAPHPYHRLPHHALRSSRSEPTNTFAVRQGLISAHGPNIMPEDSRLGTRPLK